MMRKHSWESDLHNFLEARRPMPFAWGQNDCALFAADAVAAVTGDDPGAAWRGTYATQTEAEALIEKSCGAPGLAAFAAWLTAQHAMAERPVLMAQRGDVVLLVNPDGSESLGIVGLNGLHALFVTETGLRRTRVRNCTKSWKVG